jgi:hypothetical protein
MDPMLALNKLWIEIAVMHHLHGVTIGILTEKQAGITTFPLILGSWGVKGRDQRP